MKHSYIIVLLLVSGCVETTKQASPSMPSFRVLYSEFSPVDLSTDAKFPLFDEGDEGKYDLVEFFTVYIDIPDSLKTESSPYLRVAQYLVERNNCNKNKRDICVFGFWDNARLIRFDNYPLYVDGRNMIAHYNDETENLYICGLGDC